MTLLAWLIYLPLQIVWLPLSVLGGLWVAYKQIWRSRKLGLSQTAVEVANGRWTADLFGLREDAPSRRLAGKLPNNSVLGLRLALFPLLVAKAIAGKPILYPQLPDVRATLAAIKANAAAGSVVLLDLYATRFVADYTRGAAGKTLAATGETTGFGLDFSRLQEEVLKSFATSAGFVLGQHYFLGSANKKGAFMVVAELIVPS